MKRPALDTTLLLSTGIGQAALRRTNQLRYAIELLAAGKSEREVSGLVQQRFDVSRSTSRRITKAAADLSNGCDIRGIDSRATPSTGTP